MAAPSKEKAEYARRRRGKIEVDFVLRLRVASNSRLAFSPPHVPSPGIHNSYLQHDCPGTSLSVVANRPSEHWDVLSPVLSGRSGLSPSSRSHFVKQTPVLFVDQRCFSMPKVGLILCKLFHPHARVFSQRSQCLDSNHLQSQTVTS